VGVRLYEEHCAEDKTSPDKYSGVFVASLVLYVSLYIVAIVSKLSAIYLPTKSLLLGI
jgi:hypothetical protein